MLVGLIADTHDNHPLVEQAAAFFRERRADLVLHLGDITAPSVIERLDGLPLVAVEGNNDSKRQLDPALAKVGAPPLALEWESMLEGVHLAAHHGHVRPALRAEPDVILHGHTHRRRAARIGRTLVVNPGALHRAQPRTIALLNVPTLAVVFYEVGEGGVRRIP